MTNEEKAKKIVDSIFSSGFNTNRTFYEMAYNAAMEMADFKDRQYLALLDTLIKSGADPQIVHDFIVINDIDVDQIIL